MDHKAAGAASSVDRIELLKAVSSTDEYRQNLMSPFSAEFWGKKWVVATNGWSLAAFESTAELRADGPNIAKAVGEELAPTCTATLAALREWAGEEVSEECEVCDGEGDYDADCECPDCSGTHDCDDCGGSGRAFPVRYGRLAGGVLNRNLLAKVLKSAPADGEASIAKAGDMAPFLLRAGDWMAAIMPIRPSSNDAKDCKVEFTALVTVDASKASL